MGDVAERQQGVKPHALALELFEAETVVHLHSSQSLLQLLPIQGFASCRQALLVTCQVLLATLQQQE